MTELEQNWRPQHIDYQYIRCLRVCHTENIHSKGLGIVENKSNLALMIRSSTQFNLCMNHELLRHMEDEAVSKWTNIHGCSHWFSIRYAPTMDKIIHSIMTAARYNALYRIPVNKWHQDWNTTIKGSGQDGPKYGPGSLPQGLAVA